MISGDTHLYNDPNVRQELIKGYTPSGGDWAPFFDHDMYAALSRARLMAGEGTDTFDGLLGFLEEIISRDYYSSSFEQRWGLDEDMARLIVESYGIDWIYGTINPLAQKWWNDFENCNNFENLDKSDNDYAELAFYYIHQYITDNDYGSQQLHLLFNPALIFEGSYDLTEAGWEPWSFGSSGGQLATYIGNDVYQWGDPGNPGQYFPASMAYFDIQFFIELYSNRLVWFGLQSHIYDCPTLMDSIWENRPVP